MNRALAAAAAALLLAAAPRVNGAFSIQQIAAVSGARELAAAANGDLIVGTSSGDVFILPNAESHAGQPVVFAHFDDPPAAGVALGPNALFVGTQFGIWRVQYRPGERVAASQPQKLAPVRTSGVARDHVTTSLAYANGELFASVGSSCNACVPDLDTTRATIRAVELDAGRVSLRAIRIRNAIALAISPTGNLWAGVAGVDDLPPGHPFEIFDAVTLHAGIADYGWPSCYEDRRQASMWPGDCSRVAIPRVVFPAYATPIGAVFYPLHPSGKYVFPAAYRGGAFVTLHGSWHGPQQGLPGYVAPRVVFVPMSGDAPRIPVNWSSPNAQWIEFVWGYQDGGSAQRIGRPTGIAVGSEGSLFLADDFTGAIYRIRPR